MADIVRLTLKADLGNDVCIFNFDNKTVSIQRDENHFPKGQSLFFQFSDITDVIYRAPKRIMPGAFWFIINGRLLYEKQDKKGNFVSNVTIVMFKKSDENIVKSALNRFISECKLSGLKDWNSVKAPKEIYSGDFNLDPNAKPLEYRIKCNVCGKLFCYSDEDIRRNEELQNKAKTIRREGVTQTLFTSQITGNQSLSRAQQLESQIMDYSKCPNCGSKDLTELSEEEFKAAQTPAAQAAPASSPMDELKKLKELLDMGIVTQEEFDAKKKQLLGL